MIWVVVYGHLCFSGLAPSAEVIEDNHAYAAAGQQNSLGVRYMSLVRQWCIPMLFWVSGAASSFSYKGDWASLAKGTTKIAAITILGVLANGVAWAMGPQDPQCSAMSPCIGKGVLFDFTIVPDSGKIFPIVFQMWFTMCLMLLMLLNRPLFCALSQQGSVRAVSVQWLFTMLLTMLCVQVSSPSEKSLVSTWPLLAWIATFEAVFDVAAVAAVGFRAERPRLFHYICAVATVAQVSLSPINTYLGEVTGLYIFLMCHKLYALGFVMTRTRETATALVSRCWPLAVVLGVLVAPSSSWSMSGHMTYPYYAEALDRGLYLAGALLIIFALDRASRSIACEQLPAFVGNAGLLLYLLHPAIATCLVASGMRTIVSIWFWVTIIAMAIAYAKESLQHPTAKTGPSKTGKSQSDMYAILPA